jgi:predicted nucleotide-binding protein
MKKDKNYDNTRFSADVLREAIEVFRTKIVGGKAGSNFHMTVEVDGSGWNHDSFDEFFADFRKHYSGAVYQESNDYSKQQLRLQVVRSVVLVSVTGPNRGGIEAVFDVFEKHRVASQLPLPKRPPPPPPEPPRIFIGHGGDPQWRTLKDHLHEKHAYVVEAYEIGARAGHAIRDVLVDMLTKSSFAVLVMTGEDRTSEGGMRARQNVIHEAGLFQGRLGFSRAIVVLEEGVEEFSNIHGIDQIRFAQGRIKETFGDVVATIKREFTYMPTPGKAK